MSTENSKLSYAIIGTGAIGGYYGSRLAQSGCPVHFLLRSDYAHVKDNRLRVESVDGDFSLAQVNAYQRAADIPPVDVVIVALKTTHNPLLNQLLPQIKPSGAILSLQNGFGVEAKILQQLEENNFTVPNVLGGLCFICSNKVGPGHFRHLDYGRILLGAHQKSQQKVSPTPLMKRIVDDFQNARIEIDTTDDLPMARWQKLVWNVPYNGLSVVLDATTEEMMANSGVRSLITTLMQEVVTAANTWGEQTSPDTDRKIPDDVITKMLAHTETMAPYRTSMKLDFDRGQPLEIEAILERPISIAHKFNLPTPAMTMLHQQITFLNARQQDMTQ
ncbi:MAG: putative 2-dehydropantoate 2-reductase [Cyanobacteria bacterium J06621_11]